MAEDWLEDGAEIAKVTQSMDWLQTALGAMEFWPSNLRTNLMLKSNFLIAITREPRHIQPDNERYWPDMRQQKSAFDRAGYYQVPGFRISHRRRLPERAFSLP